MTKNPAAIPDALRRDRRSGRDRRKADKGPVSGRDRRVQVEPRRPEVVELEVTADEWAALQAQASPPKVAG